MITPALCRGARGLLGWSADELAKRAGIARQTLASFESGERQPTENTMQAIVSTLVSAGVEFFGGERPGVRFSPPKGR
jgi:transcriptional regulator with XRE-family HTH domain